MTSKMVWTGAAVLAVLLLLNNCLQPGTAQGVGGSVKSVYTTADMVTAQAVGGSVKSVYTTADMDASRAPFGFRPGSPTETNSCQNVREVPQSLRSAANIKPKGLDNFYQKYTEAYGIPVLGSKNVSDSALQRACYTLRFMFADHSQIRKWYYYMSGRVAVIGEYENTIDIPEHSFLPDSYNTRARGLGALARVPICTIGEENILCLGGRKDRWWPEDIFLHEAAHGVDVIGARLAIPDFAARLNALYNRDKAIGLWNNTYAMSNPAEMFAEAVQSYFNVQDYSATPTGVHGPISTRDKLKRYDPELYKLVQEIFPCGNSYINRCDTTRDKEDAQVLRMNCDIDGSGNGDANDDADIDCKDIDRITDCWRWSKRGECDKNPTYMHFNCKKTCQMCDVKYMEDETGLGYYRGPCADRHTLCAKWASIGECKNNPNYMRSKCKKSCDAC